MNNIIIDKIIEKEIAIDVDVPYSDEVNYMVFSKVLNDVSASYKMYWLLAILEEVQEGNNIIEFRKLICRMIASAWYPISTCKLSFGACDNLEKVVSYVIDNHRVKISESKDKLIEFFYTSEDKILNKMIKDLTYNVPYRFLSPFFEDKVRGKRTGVEAIITELSNEDKYCIYTIHKDKINGDFINIREGWVRYLKYNYKIIKGWAFYNLVCFIQKRNPNVPGIAMKLEAPLKRELTKQTNIWKKIILQKGIIDLYTGKPFTEDNFKKHGVISIDHFIPWSFVLHDQMWNLVPTFKNINSSKSDKLLIYEDYIDEVCKLQFDAFKFVVDDRKNEQIEEYRGILRLNDASEFRAKNSFEEFEKRYKESIYPIYNIAKNQGFSVMDFKDILVLNR